MCLLVRQLISFTDYDLKSCIREEIKKSLVGGSSKRNFPLPIFQNEPAGKSTSTLICEASEPRTLMITERNEV